MSEDVAWLLGQSSERQVLMAQWVTDTAEHGPVAQALLYPAGHGVARQMRAIAELAGLAPGNGDDMPVVHPSLCRMLLDPDSVRLELGGHALDPSPYRPQWRTATEQGRVLLIVGMDPYSGRDADLDRYLSRLHRLRLGLVEVTQE